MRKLGRLGDLQRVIVFDADLSEKFDFHNPNKIGGKF
jgi:hypothetical protein